MQHTIPLQLSVSDLVLQHGEFLFVLLLKCVETPLTVFQLVDQLLFDGDLTCNVCQVLLNGVCGTKTY